MISMTENSLQSFSPLPNGVNMFKEPPTLLPSSPTIRILSYIKDPHKLSRRQACWSLFLQDFDIVWKVLPGTKLAPADALSCYNQVDTSSDNVDTTIVPEPAVINALDLTLARHIQSSFSTDPLVLCTIQNLSDDTPLFPCSSLADWTFDNGHLYYKGQMYVPPPARSSLLHSIHFSPLSGHLGRFRTKAIIECDFWLPRLSVFVNKTRPIHTL